jgi:hypothetical protein
MKALSKHLRDWGKTIGNFRADDYLVAADTLPYLE